MPDDKMNKFVVVLLVAFISAVFLSMIRSFLMAIFLAGIFSALARPVYHWLADSLKGRRSLASVLTLLLIIIVVVLPLAVLTGVVTGQAIKVSQTAVPWVKTQLSQPGAVSDFLENIPYYDKVAPHSELILRKAGEMVGSISQFLINNLRSATMGAVNFLFMIFTWLYTMYFFLMDGDKLLEKILYYLPLQDHDEQQMLDRFTSVTRATLKGTAVIGILQGGLAGVAFWAVGIPSATFWGVIMVVLSIIPSVGTAIVWVPVALILGFGGAVGKAIGLFVFCGLVVGSLDNLLRPILVGKDTQMHELMIFFGTMGGIFMFGMVGVIIGPIIAALFVTVWEIYGQAFRDILPDTGYVLRKREQEAEKEAAAGDTGGEE
ncbi:AI-2E family transporter [Desulfosarcina alkanivorans]|uniref:AI-2E family transporter n=1 Tax=Desulfosarcina alkanivorans TaxID=571177 RepID=A0A5K7YJ22_9BACT|nr:AI-2E family transporter [Desulfosarcina alkanivorans]BBO67869.1 AI-2E family transporter [Desulfosarcina alkanivorans]